jgi:transposase
VDIGPALIVLEATGGYETALVATLAAAGLPVVVANPRQVWDVAKATGRLAKTDRLDSAVLALFAERVVTAPRILRPWVPGVLRAPAACRRTQDARTDRAYAQAPSILNAIVRSNIAWCVATPPSA